MLQNKSWPSVTSASDLRPGIGALRKHAWDGYVEPSSSEGKYVRKPLKKQASIFISEEDHAKLRGLNIKKVMLKCLAIHNYNPKIEHLMNNEARTPTETKYKKSEESKKAVCKY